ncbi:chaperone SurA [Pedobacter glucosidilyticus]|uniref:Peptidylprolyl isomerase n=1 Tax=Pedobacter aquae TaxID=2605747 RepID=A0A5C0VH05_9SPHI|nr:MULTISPECIES: peptidylprolyl isomerase [Pedobacter]KHJ37532.1 chaperone SurA [Pedobacter glucosidilyticus]QEK52008.1 peptidylprolyl isomerase [Pedobacter aquae]
MKKYLIIALLFVSNSLLAQKKVIDKVVAVVGDNVILQSEVDQQYAQYLVQGTKPDPGIKCYILQNMLSQKLLSQQAVIDSITVNDDEVDEEIDRRMRRSIANAGGQDRLEEFLGRSVLQYKDEIRPDIKEQLVAQKMQAKITEKVEVTPLDVRRFFNEIPKDSLPTFNTEVEVGELVVYPELTKKEKEFYKDKAEALRLRVKSGDNFGTLARLYSQDPGSAADGGELPFFDRQTMAKEFTAWAFKLKEKEMSPVFETEFGFHFLEVLERKGEQVRARHILVIPETTPASLDRAKVEIDSIYKKVIDKKMDFSTAASLYSDNNDTKYNGGMILNYESSNRTTFIPTDKLDPAIFLVVDTMKVGTYSNPEVFADARGKKGYRFLYLRSKTPPHKANLEQDLPKLKDAAYETKVNKVVSEWFEKRRKASYIKIDKEFQSCDVLQEWVTKPVTAKE